MNARKKTGWQDFVLLCAKTPDAQSTENLFNLFFTQEEKNDLAKRFLIIQELLKGTLTQREMAIALDVSIAKITRGSNALKALSAEFKSKLLKKIVKVEMHCD